jgi:UDP-N-acetylglucosamine transferase subunit ALG13
VAWAASSEVCPRLQAEGFSAHPAGLGEGDALGDVFRRFPELLELTPRQRPEVMFPKLFGTVRAGPMLADLVELVRTWKPALVVHDTAELAAPIAAAASGVPSVSHGFGKLLPPNRMAAAGEEVAPLWEAQGLSPRPYAGAYDHLYLDIYPPLLRGADAPHVPARQSLRPVPFATPGGDALPPWITEASPLPLVYVTFGTVFNRDLAPVVTVVEALGELPVRAIVTVGPAGDPDAFAARAANVHVARYVPQTELLPRCDIVVSHAGSGTFLASLGQGLPQLCLPQGADQFLNAATAAQAGAGLELQPGSITVEAVAEAVEQLLSDPSFRTSAGRIGSDIAAMPGPDVVADELAARFDGGGG